MTFPLLKEYYSLLVHVTVILPLRRFVLLRGVLQNQFPLGFIDCKKQTDQESVYRTCNHLPMRQEGYIHSTINRFYY